MNDREHPITMVGELPEDVPSTQRNQACQFVQVVSYLPSHQV